MTGKFLQTVTKISPYLQPFKNLTSLLDKMGLHYSALSILNIFTTDLPTG